MRIFILIFFLILVSTETLWTLDKFLELKYNIEDGGDAISFIYKMLNDIIVFFIVQSVVVF
jgi:hypothetical protein